MAPLVTPGLVRWAALALVALLAALFPANVDAARAELMIAGRPALPLGRRCALQLFWIACLVRVAGGSAAAA